MECDLRSKDSQPSNAGYGHDVDPRIPSSLPGGMQQQSRADALQSRQESPTPSTESSNSKHSDLHLQEAHGHQKALASPTSTPPTSLQPTPEQAPISSVPSATHNSEYPLPLIANQSGKGNTTGVSAPLTSESLLPLQCDDRSPHGTSAPSVASSSEAHDLLGPLPIARPTPPERPSLSRGHMPTRQLNITRMPLPSPPAMGLSELLSGTSLTPNTEGTSYFTAHHSESSSLTRSSSGSKRTPQYSPFRSYYGEVSRPDPPRQQNLPNKIDKQRQEVRPVLSSSRPRSDSSSSYSNSQGKRSPRVQNKDGVLAPHGSFTTVRRAQPADTPQPDTRQTAASDSQLYIGATRKPRMSSTRSSEDEKYALEKAAASGDQLAMYRLGWRADTPNGQRYQIGSIENVWGPISPNLSSTRRSSRSSQSSIASLPVSPNAPVRHAETDLFSDAAGLAMRSNAASNHTSRYR